MTLAYGAILAVVTMWGTFLLSRYTFVRLMMKARQVEIQALALKMDRMAQTGKLDAESEFFRFWRPTLDHFATMDATRLPSPWLVVAMRAMGPRKRRPSPPPSPQARQILFDGLALIAEVYRYRSVTFWVVFKTVQFCLLLLGAGLRVYEGVAWFVEAVESIKTPGEPSHA